MSPFSRGVGDDTPDARVLLRQPGHPRHLGGGLFRTARRLNEDDPVDGYGTGRLGVVFGEIRPVKQFGTIKPG